MQNLIAGGGVGATLIPGAEVGAGDEECVCALVPLIGLLLMGLTGLLDLCVYVRACVRLYVCEPSCVSICVCMCAFVCVCA